MSRRTRLNPRHSVAPVLATLLVAYAAPAFAAAAVEEVIVTAQRRSENAQRVPISVATVTAKTIESLGVTNTESLGQLLPGVQLNRSGQGVITYVRGVGSGSAVAGNEPSVAMFIDDVYMPNGSGAVFDFNNIDSVSVLKGPQGTLFGRNATGGVIQVKTRDPDQKPELAIDAGYGNYRTTTTSVYANTGITQNLAINFAGHYADQNEGWGRNFVIGQDHFTNLAYGARSKVKANFGDNTTLLVTGTFDRRLSDEGGLSVSVVPGTFGFNNWSPQALGMGFYDAANNQLMKYINQSFNISAKLEHDFGKALLRSITAYGDVRFFLVSESDASPTDIPSQNAQLDQGSTTFTQELQLLSPAGSQIQWILGGFYLHDLAKNHTFNYAGTDMFGRQRTSSYSGFGQITAELLPKLKGTFGIRYTSDRRSFDGQGYNRLTGARSIVVPTTVSGIFLPTDASFNNTTSRFALDYQITDDVMVYAAYNKGFKSGIYNVGGVVHSATGFIAPPGPVSPEALDAYSIGLKSEFWNRRARANFEYYYYDYSNIKVSQVVGTSTLLTNGGKATIQGVDVDLTLVPVDRLTLNWSMSYAHGTYDAFTNGSYFFPQGLNARVPVPAASSCANGTLAPVDGTGYPTGAAGGAGASRFCNLTGNDTVQTAPFTSTFTANYVVPTEIGDFDVTGSYYYGGKYYFTEDNNPHTRQVAINLVNAALSWTSPSKMFGLTLWSNNLTGQEYYNAISENATGGFRYTPAAPRTYGVTAHLKFGG